MLGHGAKIPHVEQLSLCFETAEPEPQLDSLCAARKIPCATTKMHNKYFFFGKNTVSMWVSLKLSIANTHPQILSEVTIPMHPTSFYCQYQQLWT